MSAPSTLSGRLSNRAQWILIALLVASIFINYIDRSNLAIAAPVVERELGLSVSEMGTLFAAFFWTYALFQLFGIAGWMADRFHVGWVLAGGFIVWSGATVVTGLVTGFTALFIVRLVLGAGESVAYPCYSRILASDVPQHRRGIANALIDAGSKLGPALGTALGTWLLASVGWRMFFIVLGVGGMLWLIPWFIWMPRGAETGARKSSGGPTVWLILTKRSAWGTFLGHFCGNYFWYFLLTWLPTYLVNERKFSLFEMGRVSTIAYLVIAGSTIVAGWVSDRWIASGASPTLVRKTVVVCGLGGSVVIMPVALVQDINISIALLFASCVTFGVYVSNHWATTQTLAGPLAAGRWTSLQNGVGNLAGIAASWFTGVVVQQTGSFHTAFMVAGAIALTGAVMWGLVVGPVREVDWGERVG
jgi:MFS transporter, ACS family, D-galactonate transporter